MSLARLKRLEVLEAERRQAQIDAALRDFDAWREQHFTEAERALYDRCIMNWPMSDEQMARAAGSLDEARRIMADYPPLTDDENAVLDAAYARVPEDIRARLEGRC